MQVFSFCLRATNLSMISPARSTEGGSELVSRDELEIHSRLSRDSVTSCTAEVSLRETNPRWNPEKEEGNGANQRGITRISNVKRNSPPSESDWRGFSLYIWTFTAFLSRPWAAWGAAGVLGRHLHNAWLGALRVRIESTSSPHWFIESTSSPHRFTTTPQIAATGLGCPNCRGPLPTRTWQNAGKETLHQRLCASEIVLQRSCARSLP